MVLEACSRERSMLRLQLNDGQWPKLALVLEGQRGAGRRAKDDRNFIEAVLWWRRTGVPWRDLPGEFGPWKTVFNRFDRWSKTGNLRGVASGVAVIPSNGSRAQKLPFDKELYKARSEVECTFNLLKQARRFATDTRRRCATTPRSLPSAARFCGCGCETCSHLAALRELDEHRNNAHDHLLTCLVLLRFEQVQAQAHVE